MNSGINVKKHKKVLGILKIISDPLLRIRFRILKKSCDLDFSAISISAPGGATKINMISVFYFIEDLLSLFNSHKDKAKHVKSEKIINLHDHYFCAETIRDIYENKISDLHNDTSDYKTNNVVAFGHTGYWKPQREIYSGVASNSEKFDFFETPPYNWLNQNQQYKTIKGLKREYKYFIDLRGHTYSTKTYLFMASKRVFFSSGPKVKLQWEEKYLKPWENYIPVKEDLSDLEEKHIMIESDRSLYQKIVENNINLLYNELSPQTMINNLLNEIIYGE